MTAQQIDVHGLPAKWRAEADVLEFDADRAASVGLDNAAAVGISKAAAKRADADELEAALRQSGEAVYQVEFGSVGWLDTDKPTFDWWVQQGSRKCRVLYTTPPATSGLVEALRKIAGFEGHPRTPVHSNAKMRGIARAALAAHDARGGK